MIRESKTHDLIMGKLRRCKVKPLSVTVRDLGDLPMAIALKEEAEYIQAGIDAGIDKVTKGLIAEGVEEMRLQGTDGLSPVNFDRIEEKEG